MSIRALALELYRAQQKVDRLQAELENAGLDEKDRLKQELQAAVAELAQLRRMLDGAKADSPFAAKPQRKRRQ